MEIRQLEYFLAVVSEMNFSRAANRVHVVQSALSTSVAKLEKELGVELFDRSRQKISMTPAGELFSEHARQVIQTARLAKDSVVHYRGQLSGIVEFGSLVSSTQLDLPNILGEFHRTYPLVQIRLRPRQSQAGLAAYVDSIADNEFDLALVSAPNSFKFPARVTTQLLCEEPLVFVCRPDHHLAHHDHVTVAALADEDLIGWPAGYTLRSQVEEAFAAAGITPRIPYELAANYTFAASLVRAGLGSAFMPNSDAQRFPDLRAVAVQPAPMRSVLLAHAAQAQIRPATAKLAELILASVNSAATPPQDSRETLP